MMKHHNFMVKHYIHFCTRYEGDSKGMYRKFLRPGKVLSTNLLLLVFSRLYVIEFWSISLLYKPENETIMERYVKRAATIHH